MRADTQDHLHSPGEHSAAAPEAVCDSLDETEIAQRLEATLKRMLATPHMPHRAMGAARNEQPQEH